MGGSRMTRSGAYAAVVAGAVLVLSACNSFYFAVGAPDMSRVRSIFVIVDAREKLSHGTREEIMNLVRPERHDSYPFFAQFLPKEGSTWERVALSGVKVEPKISGDRISVKIPPDFIELQKDPLIALVVGFDNNEWKCEADPLVLEGESEYVISSTGLVAKR